MQLLPLTVNCQAPPDLRNITRMHRLVKCTITRDSEEYEILLQKAFELAGMVNSAAANNAQSERNLNRRRKDAFGGILAEVGWETFINQKFGNIASPTPFTDASIQIDIQLTNGEKIEVRSSFPRNGVKFGVCNRNYNFRNIGPYSNLMKPGEVQKELYLGVLFDTPKNELLTSDTVVFSLVGGSPWDKLLREGYDADLVPEDDEFAERSSYRVINFKDTFDAEEVLSCIEALGYAKI